MLHYHLRENSRETYDQKRPFGGFEQELLTPYGSRTLAHGEPGYVGRYGGDIAARDGAYHQGPSWPWLVGAYVDVARKVRGAPWDPRPALAGMLGFDRFGSCRSRALTAGPCGIILWAARHNPTLLPVCTLEADLGGRGVAGNGAA